MLKEPTIEKLKAMRLDAMASAWNEQHGKPEVNRLSFDERFGMLVDAEWLYRENRRLAKALRDAKLKLATACLEEIDAPDDHCRRRHRRERLVKTGKCDASYSPKRELDRAQIRQSLTCLLSVDHSFRGTCPLAG